MNPHSHWTDVAKAVLYGRRIVDVRYMEREESEGLGWHRMAVVIELDNGTLVWPSMDDEGNGAGALFTTDPNGATLPVL